MNYHDTFKFAELACLLGGSVGTLLAMAGSVSYGAMRLNTMMAESELQRQAKALNLNVVGDQMRGARQGMLVMVERDGQKDNELLTWCVRVLDPKGPGGLDFGREGMGSPSGPDVVVGDSSFDEAVHVCASDVAVALATLTPRARDAVHAAVSDGWVRHNAEWRHRGIGSVAEMLEISIHQGVQLCHAIRWEGVGVQHRLRMRGSDPEPEVASRATLLRFERGWLDDAELPALLHHRSDRVAVTAATQLKDLDWLADKAQRGTGHEVRLRAVLALHRLGASERFPLAVEATVMRGLGGPLHEACVAMLGDVGDVKALEAMQGLPDTEDARARIQARRSSKVGGVAIAEDRGGAVSVARQTE